MNIEQFNNLYESEHAAYSVLYEADKVGMLTPRTHKFYKEGDGSLARFEFLKSLEYKVDILNESSEDLLQILTDYIEEVEFLKRTKVNTDDSGVGAEAYDDSVESVQLSCSYHELITEEEFEKRFKTRFRSIIADKLKPSNAIYPQTPDCKSLELFKDESIDWETLQKLTYKNCEV